MMKAKIMGDKAKVERLQKQIDDAKEAMKDSNSNGVANNVASPGTPIKVSGLDEFGKKIFNNAPAKITPGKADQKHRHFDEKGERTQYYDDDNDMDLDTMVAREKRDSSSATMDYEFLNTITKSEKWAKDDRDDNGPDLYSSKAPSAKRASEREEKDLQKFKQKLINADKKVNNVLDRCWHCHTSSQFQKHMTIATGNHVFLSLPTRGSLVTGHCQIIPIQHSLATTASDEEVWDEIQNFRKCLIQMFAEEDKYVVFMETAYKFKQQHHSVIECIPLKYDAFSTAPAYFKKALMEAESEWSASKLIDTIKKGGLKNCVPANFPYFWVEFGYKQVGLVHPIDDEHKIQRDFGKQVIAGILQLDLDEIDSRRGRRPEEESLAKNFTSKFSPFDWTKALNE
eukprot:gene17411-20775_t